MCLATARMRAARELARHPIARGCELGAPPCVRNCPPRLTAKGCRTTPAAAEATHLTKGSVCHEKKGLQSAAARSTTKRTSQKA